jgi:hypothetical protein
VASFVHHLDRATQGWQAESMASRGTERRNGQANVGARRATQAETGNVRVVLGPWNQDYIEELCAFSLGVLKDQVDASSGAFNKLARGSSWSVEDIAAVGRRWRGEETIEQRRRKRAEAEGALPPQIELTREQERQKREDEVAEISRQALIRARRGGW